MTYTIHSYSSFDGYTTKSVNDNVSNIMSRMIQIAGRLCEHYASDVYYTLCSYDDAVRENYEYDRLITFYESGVIERKIENDTVDHKSDGIQYWRLTWNPKEHVGALIRVYLRRETND